MERQIFAKRLPQEDSDWLTVQYVPARRHPENSHGYSRGHKPRCRFRK